MPTGGCPATNAFRRALSVPPTALKALLREAGCTGSPPTDGPHSSSARGKHKDPFVDYGSRRQSRKRAKASFSLFLHRNATERLCTPLVKYCVCNFNFLGDPGAKTENETLCSDINTMKLESITVPQQTLKLWLLRVNRNSKTNVNLPKKTHLFMILK